MEVQIISFSVTQLFARKVLLGAIISNAIALTLRGMTKVHVG